MDYVHKMHNEDRMLNVELSEYAYKAYLAGEFGEVVAESFATPGKPISKDILNLLKGD